MEKQIMTAVKIIHTIEYINIASITPERVWINGDGDVNGNFVDIRQELDLSEIKKQLNAKSTP